MTVLEQLAEFIKDSEGRMAQSKWLADDTMNVYVRRGFHSIDGLPRICLDVASVTVAVERPGNVDQLYLEGSRPESLGLYFR